ncbi:hypothetical protein BGZ79_009588 [Entomortierella chlamydospora]|nr:hypothetical protein BGZ79_009588 [Entomortierella chlamydospora]
MAVTTDTSKNLYLPKIIELVSAAVQALAQNSGATTPRPALTGLLPPLLPRFDKPPELAVLEPANKHEQSITKFDPKELLTTLCPDLGSDRTLPTESARLSSSQSNGGDGTLSSLAPPQVPLDLKSILRKPRSFQTARHQVHVHPRLGPMLQSMHLSHLQLQETQQQHYILQKHTYINLNNAATTPSKTSLGKSTNVHSRPLPTPPIIKHVRWSTHNEVLEIENIDDLILLGYYDDYDGDLGWDYRDESQEYSSSDEDEETEERGLSISDDKEVGQFGGLTLRTKNAPFRDTSPDLAYHQQLQPHSQSPPSTCSDYGFDTESDTSTIDEESEIAEDELIERFENHYDAFGSLSSIAESNQVFEATSDFGCVLKGKAPRLDRREILAEVAARKQNGMGAFARRTGPRRSAIAPRVFAVNKPTDLTSTTIIDLLQHVCKKNRAHPLVKRVLELDGSKRAKRGLVKIGHGGTLDPLARGVVGMGAGCKMLHNMTVSSSKVYIAEARLGFSSTTLDSTGSLVAEGPTDHVTRATLMQTLNAFKGEIKQTPPLYSALNMDGKRLYDYAREGLALPREIPSRKVQIHELELLSFPDDSIPPDPILEQYKFRGNSDTTITTTSPVQNFKTGFQPKRLTNSSVMDPSHVPIPTVPRGLVFHIRVHCSSGTYIRTLIADIAAHLGTVGHMTDLLRVEQSGFKLGGLATLEMEECEDVDRVDQAIQAGNRIQESMEDEHM